MQYELTSTEVRVLGCLIEKEATTPDQYPLSLNALTNACNQKSNRKPVMNLSENDVMDAVESLITKSIVSSRSGTGSRVPKYKHRLKESLYEESCFSQSELAVLAVLFLRGPQTMGEIRTRGARIHGFSDLSDLSSTLANLTQREGGPFITKLDRQPGQKDSRYAHLFCGDVENAAPSILDIPAQPHDDSLAGLTELEARVTRQQLEIDELKERLEKFIRQFE